MMKTLSVAVFLVLFVDCAWSAMMAGGLRDVELNDTSVLNAANFAVSKHNLGKNDMFRSDMVEVVSAQSQVVSGMKYVITVKLQRTNCRKNRDTPNCGGTEAFYECTFTVWSRPWMNDIKLMKDTCNDNSTSM